MNKGIGQPVERLDGYAKVTGAARYSADWPTEKLAHAVAVTSAVAKGAISHFDLRAAKAVQGFIDIVTFENAPRLKMPKATPGSGTGENFIPLQSNEIFYNDQYIAVVVAETFEAATQAAKLVVAHYRSSPAVTDLAKTKSYVVKEMPGVGKLNFEFGNFKKAAKAADASGFSKIHARYKLPIENHNPMEPCATIANFSGDQLTVYDSNQGVASSAHLISELFGLSKQNVRTITKFVGGGFGCKGSLWSHQALAVMAALKTKRPVKLVVTRQQMFTGVGHRAQTIQDLTLAASQDGKLTAISHETLNGTAVNKDFSEMCGMATPMLYKCENISVRHRLAKLNFQTPTYMRAPGHSSGSFALESAMDELAHSLNLDPIELRNRNYAESDQSEKKLFSSKSLRQCFDQGARQFGWSERSSKPQSKREGDWWVGYGVATATYPAKRFPAQARVTLQTNGEATVTSATQDIGTGTYTVMAQVAADSLGMDFAKVHFDLGDSRYPTSSVSGGSTTMASVGSAIKAACQDVIEQLKTTASLDPKSPLHGLDVAQIRYEQGHLSADAKPKESLQTLVSRGGANITGNGKTGMQDDVSKQYSGHSFGAQFIKLRVHSVTGEVRLDKALGAFAAGRIVNPLTAKSQYEGGMIMGIGMALMEATLADMNSGRLTVRDLADYHIPTQMDVPALEVIMVDEHDEFINPIGVKGIGEIGITGIAAAVANAVFNAAGVRIREIPITPDLLIAEFTRRTATQPVS